MIAVAIMALLIRQQKTHWMLPIAIGLYLYGEFAGSSAVVTGMSAPIYTRNGPFFSTLFVVVGYLIRERRILWQARSALLLAMMGMAFHFIEAYGLHQHGRCLTPMIICLAPLCGNWAVSFPTRQTRSRPKALGIFTITKHPRLLRQSLVSGDHDDEPCQIFRAYWIRKRHTGSIWHFAHHLSTRERLRTYTT